MLIVLFFYFIRMHIHVESSNGEAKFWLEPLVALAHSQGLSKKQLLEIQRIVEEQNSEVSKAWKKHFGS